MSSAMSSRVTLPIKQESGLPTGAELRPLRLMMSTPQTWKPRTLAELDEPGRRLRLFEIFMMALTGDIRRSNTRAPAPVVWALEIMKRENLTMQAFRTAQPRTAPALAAVAVRLCAFENRPGIVSFGMSAGINRPQIGKADHRLVMGSEDAMA
jgi:hypothetical protein